MTQKLKNISVGKVIKESSPKCHLIIENIKILKQKNKLKINFNKRVNCDSTNNLKRKKERGIQRQ